jgi:hypothetical protein
VCCRSTILQSQYVEGYLARRGLRGVSLFVVDARAVHESGATLSFTNEGAVIAPPRSKLN